MKSLINTIHLLQARPKSPKAFCMFDNMQKDNRLVINALCEFDPLEDWGAWKSNQLRFPLLLKKLVKYKPDAKQALSYTRFVLANYKGNQLKIDLRDGTIIRPLRNIKFAEGPHTIKGFSILNHHTTAVNTPVLNRRVEIILPEIGKIILTTQNRGLNINLDDDVQKSLTPANSRGALVSELCAHEIPKLSTILPLTKSQDEIDYANKTLEDRWLKNLNEFEKWKKENPEQHTNDKWTQMGDSKGGKRKIPTEKPEKVKW
jgi:hypothetical protein